MRRVLVSLWHAGHGYRAHLAGQRLELHRDGEPHAFAFGTWSGGTVTRLVATGPVEAGLRGLLERRLAGRICSARRGGVKRRERRARRAA